MLEILKFYVSGFWTWFGITWGIGLIGQVIVAIVVALRKPKDDG